MLDLHLMSQSNEVYQQKVIVTWSKKVERLPCLVVLLPLAIQPLDNIRKVLSMLFSKVLGFQKFIFLPSLPTMLAPA